MKATLCTATVLTLLQLATEVHGHAYMSVPTSRNWRARLPPSPTEYCPHCKSGGGVGGTSSLVSPWPYPETVATSRRHGLCGDNPRDTVQKYLQNGPIVAEYNKADVITIETTISTHHRGHYEFWICNMDTNPDDVVTQECLNKYPLKRDLTDTAISPPDTREGYEGRYYIEPRCAATITDQLYNESLNDSPHFSTLQTGQKMRMRYLLPANLSCDHCVLQWWWITGNSCNAPGYRTHTWPSTFASCSGDGPGLGWWGQSLNDCGGATGGYPEEFWNCADIKIVDTDPPPPTAPPPPTPAPPPTVTNAPTTQAPTLLPSVGEAVRRVTGLWGSGGCQHHFDITFTSSVSQWYVVIVYETPFPGPDVFGNMWMAKLTSFVGNVMVIENEGWNGQQSAGSTVAVGVNYKGEQTDCYPVAEFFVSDSLPPAPTAATASPTGSPTTAAPTTSPVTAEPTVQPSDQPTPAPTSARPTFAPTLSPSPSPTLASGFCGAGTTLVDGTCVGSIVCGPDTELLDGECRPNCFTRRRRSVEDATGASGGWEVSSGMAAGAAVAGIILAVVAVLRAHTSAHSSTAL